MQEDSPLSRRVGVLESILGVDTLDAEQCTGDSQTCQGACVEGRCPMEHHPTTNQRSDLLLRCVVEELEQMRIVPEGTWSRVQLRAQCESTKQQMLAAQEHLLQLKSMGVEGCLLQQVQQQHADLKALLAHLQGLSNARAAGN